MQTWNIRDPLTKTEGVSRYLISRLKQRIRILRLGILGYLGGIIRVNDLCRDIFLFEGREYPFPPKCAPEATTKHDKIYNWYSQNAKSASYTRRLWLIIWSVVWKKSKELPNVSSQWLPSFSLKAIYLNYQKKTIPSVIL